MYTFEKIKGYLEKVKLNDWASIQDLIEKQVRHKTLDVEINTGVTFEGQSLNPYNSVKVPDFQKSKLGVKGAACILAELSTDLG